MSFHEVRFPDAISRGARGGPERRTQVVELALYFGDAEKGHPNPDPARCLFGPDGALHQWRATQDLHRDNPDQDQQKDGRGCPLGAISVAWPHGQTSLGAVKVGAAHKVARGPLLRSVAAADTGDGACTKFGLERVVIGLHRCTEGRKIGLGYSEPPHLNWSTVMFRRRRTRNGEQAAQARGNSSEAAAG